MFLWWPKAKLDHLRWCPSPEHQIIKVIIKREEDPFIKKDSKMGPRLLYHVHAVCHVHVVWLTLSDVCSLGLLDEEQVVQFFGWSSSWSCSWSRSCSWFLCNTTTWCNIRAMVTFTHKQQTLKYISFVFFDERSSFHLKHGCTSVQLKKACTCCNKSSCRSLWFEQNIQEYYNKIK